MESCKGKKIARIEITNIKYQINSNDQNSKPVYDLEERTFQFAKADEALCLRQEANELKKIFSSF